MHLPAACALRQLNYHELLHCSSAPTLKHTSQGKRDITVLLQYITYVAKRIGPAS